MLHSGFRNDKDGYDVMCITDAASALPETIRPLQSESK